mmetsp:Transcript_68129/g.197471  ORF Transcript_68129/g.197471 Transcript_68129/m.197471 type:complete len:441 (-) Transcript_68129:86-1408(-)
MTTTNAKQGRNSQFSKTKMCRFELLGMCAKGAQCQFAHGPAELKPLPDLKCTKLCRELLQNGQCTSKNCTYAHTREELRQVAGQGQFGVATAGGAPSDRSDRRGRPQRGGKGGGSAAGVGEVRGRHEPLGGACAATTLGAGSNSSNGVHLNAEVDISSPTAAFDWSSALAAIAAAANASVAAGAMPLAPGSRKPKIAAGVGDPAYIPLRTPALTDVAPPMTSMLAGHAAVDCSAGASASASHGIAATDREPKAFSLVGGLGLEGAGPMYGCMEEATGAEHEHDVEDDGGNHAEGFDEFQAMTGFDSAKWEMLLASGLRPDIAGSCMEAGEESASGMLADTWGLWGNPWGWAGCWGSQLGNGMVPGAAGVCDAALASSVAWPSQSMYIAQQDEPFLQVGRLLDDAVATQSSKASGSSAKAPLRAVRTSESTLCTLGDEHRP